MRKAHVLEKNKSKSIEHYWLFWDTEAYIEQVNEDIQRQTIRLGCATYVRLNNNLTIRTRKSIRFTNPDDLVRFIYSVLKPGKTLHIVSHNTAYDVILTDLLNRLAKDGFTIDFLYLEKPTVIVKMSKGKLRLSIEDGYNRLRGKIEDWGKKLGLPKLTVDYTDVDDETLFRYCERDVEILLQATLEYLRFIQRHDLGAVKYTVSGQAFTAFRHRFMAHKIYIHDHADAIRLERDAYGGGMVRVFRKGHFEGETYYQLDVNSMYAYVMRSFDYPVKLIAHRSDVDVAFLRKYIDNYCVIARCVVKPRTPAFRCKWLGKITYPVALFEGCFTTEELKLLLREDAIVHVIEAAVYRKATVFADYVDYFWNLRAKAIAEGDEVLKALTKQYLNSLYGKFGARHKCYQHNEDISNLGIKIDSIYNDKLQKQVKVYWIGEKAYLLTDEKEGDDSFVAIAAEITANARMTLWRYVSIAGMENTYYTDTDSLIVNQEGYERLKRDIDKNGLGKLKLETVADTLTVYARKDYEIGDKMVLKGVDEATVIDGVRRYYRNEWTSLNAYLKAQGVPEVLIRRRLLHLERICYDGWTDENGFVHPFEELPSDWETKDVLVLPGFDLCAVN